MNKITLDTPIKRGDTAITEIDLRKPLAGELRGCSLTELLQMDVSALTRLLPRVTQPALTEAEIGRMDPADLLQLGAQVTAFLLPTASRPDASLAG
ncbi:MAG: phage tail assembly protein [Rubrivivax sp.]